MSGLILALVASFCFALSQIFMRRGVYRSGESFSPTPISAFLGTVLFAILILMSGKAGELMSLSWLGVASLALAGVIHLVLGRILAYTSLRLVGANLASPIVNCNMFFATLLGLFFFGEELTIPLVLAFLLILGGIILLSTTGDSETQRLGMTRGSLVKGILAASGAALCWGVSPVLVKIGLAEVNSSLLAVFVSYIAASVVTGSLLFHSGNRDKFCRLNRASLIPIIIGAVATTAAQILRYTALDYSPVSIVIPIISINALLVLPLSFLFNREIEVFGIRLILGAIAVVAGVLLMFWAV